MGDMSNLNFQLPTYELVEAESLRRSFPRFVRAAWHVIEPGVPFEDNWHIQVIADHLQAVTEGKINTLIINLPFRSSKSSLVSVLWPAWEWINYPHFQYLTGSYDGDLATRDCVNARRLIQSKWYQSRWGHKYALTEDQNAKTRYQNDHNGHRVAVTVAGGISGEGGDRRIIDDPHDAVKAMNSIADRQKVKDWLDHGMSTRENDPRNSALVLIMQRVAPDDATGHILAKRKEAGERVDHVVIPMSFDGVRRKTILGEYDPRRKKGELMWPVRQTAKWVKQKTVDLGVYGSSAQLQQKPTPRGGLIFKQHEFQYYTVLPPYFDEVIVSVDCSFKDLKTSDFVAFQAWGRTDQVKYLLKRYKAKLSFSETCKTMELWRATFPNASAFVVEDKANGPAVINTLKGKIPGLVPFQPMGGKLERGYAIQPQVEAGQVYLPDPEICPEIIEYLEEVCAVPGAPNDDEFDATTQAITYLSLRLKAFGGLMDYYRDMAAQVQAPLTRDQLPAGTQEERSEDAFWHSVTVKRKQGSAVT